MKAKINKISNRKFIRPFYHRFLDGIGRNSSKLVIMSHYPVPNYGFQTLLLYDRYGTNT